MLSRRFAPCAAEVCLSFSYSFLCLDFRLRFPLPARYLTSVSASRRQEAGLPDGVVNVIHGEHEAVDFICDNPDIRAISFVGSDQAVRGRVLTL